MAAVSHDELIARLTEGSFVLLDRLEATITTLPHDRDIVAYCRGRTACSQSRRWRRSAHGASTAWRLEDGFLEWQAAGLTIEVA